MPGIKSPYGPQDDFGYRRGEDALGLDEQERALWNQARSENDRFAIMEQRDARRLKEHQEREKQEWPTTRAGQLLKKLGECFAEYKECLEHDPRLQEKALAFDEMNQKIFNKMRNSIERAQQLSEMPAPESRRRDMPRAASARQEILPYARDAGRGASGKDQFAEPERCERYPWSDCQRSAGGSGRQAGLQTGVNTGVLPATGIEQY